MDKNNWQEFYDMFSERDCAAYDEWLHEAAVRFANKCISEEKAQDKQSGEGT